MFRILVCLLLWASSACAQSNIEIGKFQYLEGNYSFLIGMGAGKSLVRGSCVVIVGEIDVPFPKINNYINVENRVVIFNAKREDYLRLRETIEAAATIQYKKMTGEKNNIIWQLPTFDHCPQGQS